MLLKRQSRLISKPIQNPTRTTKTASNHSFCPAFGRHHCLDRF